MSDMAIADVGETLVELLRNNMKDLFTKDFGEPIALVSPGEIEGRDNIRLSLFLYHIEKNIYYDQEMEKNGHSALRAPPLALNLYYMLTAYPSPGERTEGTLEEHRILGRAVKILHDNPVLTDSILKESLSASGTVPHVMVTSLSLDDMTKIWSTFKEKSFRPSVCYLVTPVIIESSRIQETNSRVR